MKINMPSQVKMILDVLMAHGYDAYAVGGCIRDSLLGKQPKDWDITTSANPMTVKSLFSKTIDTGLKHGTVTILIDGEGFEVTTYRIDGAYEDNRRPKDVSFTSDLSKDLERRDFTINAMAYNDQHGIVDLFGGVEDLDKKIIRCVGKPEARFEEDALRILRGIRFSAQLEFDIDHDTQRAIREKSFLLKKISAERIYAELTKLLVAKAPQRIIMAYDLGVTGVILPEFDACMKTRQNHPHHIANVGEHTMLAVNAISPDPILRWTMFLHDFGKPMTETIDENSISHFYGHSSCSVKLAKAILMRLKADNKTIDSVTKLISYHDYRFEAEKVSVRRAMAKVSLPLFEYLLKVQAADASAQNKIYLKEKLERIIEIRRIAQEIISEDNCISLKQLAINGRDLLSLGIKPGKHMGEILDTLLNEVIKDPDLNNKDYLVQRAVLLSSTDQNTL